MESSRKEQYDPRCITKLVRNFWSHPALLEVPGRLFYHGELLLYADKVIVNSCLQFLSLTKQAKGEVPLIFMFRFCLVFGLIFIFCCSGGLWGRI